MNFQSMPLLKDSYGFTLTIILTLGLIVFEIMYFKRNKYL